MKNLELLSKRDIICLMEFIHSAHSCTKEEVFRELVNNLKRLIPYEFALCGLGKIGNGCKPISYNIINISYPSEWLELYLVKRFDKIDPILKENCLSFRLQYWADTYDKCNPSKIFLSCAEDFALRKGYTHGSRNYMGTEGGLFSFAGETLEHHPRTEIILEYLIPHLYQALIRIVGNKEKRDITLSFREKEALKWIKQGKSTWDISSILSISENTVKYHVKNILQKLDAVSRTQAVAIAMEHELIDID